MVKTLVFTEKANTQATKKAGKTAMDIATKVIKDPCLLETMTKLLKKESQSVKVNYNKDFIEMKKSMKDK